tara:strand:+ start:563 stop:826 length:264 start_codon:yes stop_codon:yes gene_type:complete
MSNKTKNIILIMVSSIALLLLVRVVFDEQFDDFERYVEERENYKGGPEAYDRNLEALDDWLDNYQKENPGTSRDDAKEAWDNAWNSN